jgi:ribosomal protein S18 acetylase RimI-like enzyme
MDMSYEPVSDGELAAVVTYLEMLEPPRAEVPQSTLRLRRVAEPDPEQYRALFRKVGSNWLWFSRLTMSDRELEANLGDSRVELYEVAAVEPVVGMLELDFREAGQCELAFIGLVPELAGQGHGRWLLAEALRLAWRQDQRRDGTRRVHVHTCTLDHPAALAAYRRAGFTAYKRAVERFPDPRLLGILPADCAPQVPLVGTLASAAPSPAS